MVSDNGPQFISQEMKEFSEKYGFRHITSLHYPQANGLAERTVNTAKSLLANVPDHRATPMPRCSCRIVDGEKNMDRHFPGE